MPESTIAVADRLHEILAPIENEIAQIDARLSEMNSERDSLLAARKQLEAVRRAAGFNGGAKKKGPPSKGVGAVSTGVAIERMHKSYSAARIEVGHEQVAAYFAGHAGELADGFTATDLEARLRGAGLPGAGALWQGIVAELLERGVLRVDRIARGGGRLYKLTEGE